MKNKGFTLTELLIVIAILGILASLAIPRLFPQTERARVSEAIAILSAIRQGEEAYRLEKGVYIADTSIAPAFSWELLGLEDPNLPAKRFFNYTVATTPGPPPTFTATTTRRNVGPGGADYGTQTFTIDNTGAWGGGANPHPMRPL